MARKKALPETIVTEQMLRDAKRAAELAARIERGDIPGQ